MGRTRRVSHFNGVGSVESHGIARSSVLYDNFHVHTHISDN
jgi:hypothetical protein